MIESGDIYKVVVAMTPLYVALGLGYASVKWWRMFKPDQCDAINRFNCYFIIPFFTFQFTAGVNPYAMNFRFLAGDVIAKAICGGALALWANLGKKSKFSWAITSFSLSCFNNTLVVGVPLLKAMYGAAGEDLVVQSSVIQSLIWFPILLFMLEFWRASCSDDYGVSDKEKPQPHIILANKHEVQENPNNTITVVVDGSLNGAAIDSSTAVLSPSPSSNFGATMKKVGGKLGKNPNCYACALGVIWALVAKRWDFEMPSIVEGSILIMAKAGGGVAMFSMGLFMALQEKVIACGMRLTIYGMVLRFVGGPLTTSIGSLTLGLRSNTLRIAIIQAALPQAIASFVFAKEYDLHADVLSTSVIFGTVVSLPLLIVYYVVLDIMR
ncbi:Auxin efflux carrier family protein [Perilla frutescens var. hirtella]|uniref:Auxin efflux carrier component n=1 Tax=Perilla frutescens var. hirtella TaxID=608512 RepID=A0AAD4ITK5_PERFH|nr:Auxin efflux carrier family protein [Perilla frutescens var. hirtella]